MKKKLLSALLVLALLITGLVVAVQADTATPDQLAAAGQLVADEADNLNFSSSYCPACGRSDVTWTAFSATYKDFVDGEHIYLTKDISVNTSGETIFIAQKAGISVCVHLNGHNVTASTKRAMIVDAGATVNVMDHKNSTAVITGGYPSKYGVAVYVKNSSTLNLYGGNYTKVANNENPVLYVTGSIANVHANTAFTCGTGTQAGVFVTGSAKFNLYSGSITGGNNTGGYGGNVRLYGGAFNMYGGSISGGAASSGGDNIYVSEGTFKMTGGTIAGEVAIADAAAATVELSGSPVITGKGLVLPKGKAMTLGSFNEDASVAIKTTGAFISADAAAYAPYFKAAVATDFVEEKDGKLYYFSNDKLTNQTSGTVTAWCPVCKENKTWSPYSSNYLSNGHYYLTGDISTSNSDGALKTSSGNTASSCVHLNGYNIIKSDSYRAVYVTLGTLNIMGNGTVQANYQNQYGCTVYMNAAATLNLYGGTYQRSDGNTYPIIRTTNGTLNLYGGATVDGRNNDAAYASVHVSGAFNMYGGVIKNGKNTSAYTGANLYIVGNKTTLYGGEITGGYAKQGANILIQGGSLEIAGAKITNGEATEQGGNLCIGGYPVTMTGGVVEGGKSPKGGNVCMTGSNNATLNMTGGVIQNGEATTGYGGNVYVYRGTLTVGQDAALIGGQAQLSGGSVCLDNASGNVAVLELYGSVTNGKAGKGGNISVLEGNSTVTMYAGALISGGEGTDTGNDSDDSWTVGNVLIKRGTFNMQGGIIRDGISTKVSKNVHLNSGAKFNMSGGIVYGNTKETSYTAGSAIRAHANNSVVTLSGDAKVIREDGKHIGVMRCYDNKLVIEEGWTGEASVTWYPNDSYKFGAAIDSIYCETTGAFSGKLVYEDPEDKPWIHADGNGGAVVADKKLIAGDTVTWPADIVTAHKNTPDSYIQLEADAALEIPAGETAFVDVKGKTLTVTGSGTVQGMNSLNCVNGEFDANAPGEIITETATIAPVANSAGGIYVALTDGNGQTGFHLLDMKITHLNLVTKRTALYYTAQYLCDEVLASKVTDYGISYSLLKMPDYDSTHGVNTSMWAAAGNKFQQTSVPYTVYGILEEGEDNAYWGKMPIYANPYIKIGDIVVMADTTTGDTVNDEGFNGVAKSLYDLLYAHDQAPLYYSLSENQKTNLNRFYTKWYEDMKDWNFKNITREYDNSSLNLSNNGTAVCPVCSKTAEWTKLTGDTEVTLEAGGHYYLAANVTYRGTDANGFISAPASGTACLHLNGKNLTANKTRAIYVSKGSLNIMGKGNVSGNAAENGGASLFVRDSGTLNLYGGTYVKATANTKRPVLGMYAGTVNMYRGSVIDGAGRTSATAPGCVLLEADKAVFNLHGGVIQNGNGLGNAGNVRLGSGSTFNMYGGSVINGVTGGDGGNFYVEKGNLNISGGAVTGAEIYAKDESGKISLSGAPQIDYLTLHSGQIATLGDMDAGASVKVNANGPFTTYNEKAADFAGYFSTMTNAARVTEKDGILHYTKQFLNDLEFIEGNKALCPACDKVVEWKALSGDVAAIKSGASYELQDGDHYYLADDVVHTGVGNSTYIWAPGHTGETACVHLNGHNLTTTDERTFHGSAGVLNIMGNGIVTGDYGWTKDKTEGATISINTGGQLGAINLYGGTYLMAADNEWHNSVISLRSGGAINVYSGACVQGMAGQYSIHAEVPGNVNNTIGIYGGKVTGGSIYMKSPNLENSGSAVFIMEDGTVDVDVELSENVKATLSGTLSIKKLVLGRGVKLNLGKLRPTEIKLTANGVFTAQTADAETYKNYFVPTNSAFDIVVKDNALYCQKNYAGQMGNTCLICEKTVTWTAISGGQTMVDGGHYYLSGDLQATVNAPASGAACLHLNGYSLAGITGNAGTVRVMGSGNVAAVTMNNANGVMDLYSGTYAAISVQAGKINLYDDAVVSGDITAAGGEVNLENAKVQGTVNVSGATFSMYNSNVAKLVAAADAKISISGAPVIGRMELAPLTHISVGQILSGANIKVLAHHTFTEPNTLLTGYAKFFHPVHESGKIKVVNNTLYYAANYVSNQTTACPYCEKDVQWKALSGATAVQLQDGDHYYLTGNIDYTGDDVFLTAPAAGKACVHLSGYNITATNAIAGGAGELSILGNGMVNGAVQQNVNGKLNLLGGTYTGSITATAGALTVHDGAALQGSVSAADTDLFLLGAKVTCNLTVENGSLQFVDATAANITLSGTPRVTLSGKVVISKLTVPEGVLMDLPVLFEGTAVDISAKGAFTAEFEKAEEYKAYFTTADEGQWIVIRDGGLFEAATVDGIASAQEQAALNSQYAGRVVKQGQFHEHSNIGDGAVSLEDWKQVMIDKDMDFFTIVDHTTSKHMKHEDWDNSLFIGGSEPQSYQYDKTHLTSKTLHYNMIFSNYQGLEAVVTKFPSFEWDGEYFADASFSAETFGRVIDEVLAQGGFFVHVHPKYGGYIESNDPLDYWWRDYTGIEVMTGDGNDLRDPRNYAAYQLWLDLLDLDKRVFAAAGSDSHGHNGKLSDTGTLTTFYAGTPAEGQTMADVYVDLARAGDMTAGPAGIRMAMGQTNMGGHTDFAKEDRLVLSVGDIHSLEYHADHTYRVDVYDDRGLIFRQELTGNETQYFAFDVSEDARFYRAEIYDVTDDYILAVGNPIWND